MQAMRIATYTINRGTSFQELLDIATGPGGICEIFGSVPGFVRFEIVDSGGEGFTGITVWESRATVDEAMATAGAHIKDVLAGRAELVSEVIGHIAHIA